MPQKGSTHSSNIRVGQETGVAATRTIGSVVLQQRWEVSAVPASGTSCFVLPTSAEISYFDVIVSGAIPGEATVRFGAVGATGSDLYGRVTVSAAGVYTISTPATAGTRWVVGASSQPIGISVVATSGAVTNLANNIVAKVIYARKYENFQT